MTQNLFVISSYLAVQQDVPLYIVRIGGCMIIKIEGVTHGQLAELVTALGSDRNRFRDQTVSTLKEVKGVNNIEFQVVVDTYTRLVVENRSYPGSASTHPVFGTSPRRYVDLIFDALGIFPDSDEPVEIK